MDFKLLKTLPAPEEAAGTMQMLRSHGIATKMLQGADGYRIYVYDGDFARAQFLVEEA